ncbi:MAG: response regulator [Nitrospinae bacterium]|nr:response regulator [Nitrospinota bacterium]
MESQIKKTKILIIDDDLNLQASLKRLLIKKGFVVDVASNGKDGLLKIGDFKPDCILLDIGMPILDGNETLKMIKWLFPKAKEAWSDSSADVIIISGVDDLKSKAEWISSGAFDFIPKPVQFEEIYNLISNSINTKN